jgi:hypothetical protein
MFMDRRLKSLIDVHDKGGVKGTIILMEYNLPFTLEV